MPPDPGSGLCPRFKRYSPQSGCQALGASGIKRHQFWQLFYEGAAWTSLVVTAKAVNLQFQTNPVLGAGQILRLAYVPAVDAAGWLLAVWAMFHSLQAVCLDVQCILGGDNVVNRKVWQFKWNGVDVLAAPR